MEMFAERTRILTDGADDGESDYAVRRRQLREVTRAQNQVLVALEHAPLRLYSKKDKKLKTLLWGVERSSFSLMQTLRGERLGLRSERDERRVAQYNSGSDSDDEAQEEVQPAEARSLFDLKINTPTADKLIEAAKLL